MTVKYLHMKFSFFDYHEMFPKFSPVTVRTSKSVKISVKNITNEKIWV